MTMLAWIIVGMMAGWLMKIAAPEEGSGGIFGDLAAGIIGALIGGWIFYSFGRPGGSVVGAFVGAVMFLWILRVLTRNRARVHA